MPGAPQVTSNGYVSSQPGGVLRFHHGKMTSRHSDMMKVYGATSLTVSRIWNAKKEI